MAGEAHQHDRIMAAAGTSLQRRRVSGRQPSIGKGSAELKARHFFRKLRRIAIAVIAILIAAGVAGLVIDGIGFAGVMATFLAVLAAVAVLTVFPRMKVPRRADLNRGDVRQLVGRTELWLEAQRPALPPPAAALIDQIGVQLDALGLQLEGIDQSHPSAVELRKLVGEHLPETVDSYRRIPGHLRAERRAGSTPDEQLAEGLGKISQELDSVTRQLADGALDDLAVRTRYLGYRYGSGGMEGAIGDEAEVAGQPRESR